ncbi:hypothetical protein ABZ622_29510 [Streptomyces sp. NPDC007164]|uniref:hypothetical protein n=1 Tax=Streptomyces sp. NPDC007164 TaxID=3156918 RepID=UPI0033F3D75F
MNSFAATYPFPAHQEPTSMPLPCSGHRIQTTLLHRLDIDQWDARVPASQLVGLGEALDAAEQLRARREFLEGSAQNLEREQVMRERPEAFGVVGRVVLGADNVFWAPDGTRSSGTLDLLGPECIDGYQQIALIARLATELSPEYLDRAVLDVRILTGSARELARSEYDRAHLYCNLTEPQDLLVRHPIMLRLVKQFSNDQCHFKLRRGERRGPHREGYSIGEATTALALFSQEPHPDLAHHTLEDKGRQEIWQNPSGQAFHTLFNERTQATGVRIAITFRRSVLDVLEEMLRHRSAHHWHLLEDAPDLVVWAVSRQLPIDWLHYDQRDPVVPEWEKILDNEVTALTQRTAERLVHAYEELRSKGVYKRAEVRELPYWHKLLKAAGMSR